MIRTNKHPHRFQKCLLGREIGVAGWQGFPVRPRTCVRNGPALCQEQCEPNRTTQSEFQHPTQDGAAPAGTEPRLRADREGQPARPAAALARSGRLARAPRLGPGPRPHRVPPHPGRAGGGGGPGALRPPRHPGRGLPHVRSPVQEDGPPPRAGNGVPDHQPSTLRGDAQMAAADRAAGLGTVENGVHYVRDVALGENACRVRKGALPRLLAAFANLAFRSCAC